MIYDRRNYHRLYERGLERGDLFLFKIGRRLLQYEYRGNRYLNNETCDNARVFELLHINAMEFCAMHYGVSPGVGDWPQVPGIAPTRTKKNMLERVIVNLFILCEAHLEAPLISDDSPLGDNRPKPISRVVNGFGLTTATVCDLCGVKIEDHNKYSETLFDNTSLCESCAHLGVSCSICNRHDYAKRFAVIDYKRSLYMCSVCPKDKGSQDILNHSYKPNPRFYATDYINRNTYYGWELEVEAEDNDISDLAVKYRNPLWYHKLDSSMVDGVEFVSYPMTLEYMKKNRDVFVKLLKGLQGDNCKSASTKTCGMHIHVSKDVITKIQLWKMLDFFRKNKKFVFDMSGRSSAKLMSRWASTSKINKNTQKHLCKKQWDFANKYTAINIRPRNTIEFRIFKGTLNPKKFFKNLEFVDALVNWARDESMRRITISQFSEYVKSHSREYPNLMEYMSQKKMFKTRRGLKKPLFADL